MSFNSVEGLDLSQVRKEVQFPVFKEHVVTEEDNVSVNSSAVMRDIDGEKKVLGLVSRKRSLLPYEEAMDWVTDEFQKTGIDFKLKESSILKRSNLFQQYLFDGEVENPDGYDISPMVILKASHIGTPLELDFGTYRFVCSNGVTVGNTIGKIKVKARDLDNLLRYSIKDDICANLEKMRDLSERYRELQNEDMFPFLSNMVLNPVIPAELKKNLIEFGESKGIIEVQDSRAIKGKNLLGAKENNREFSTYEGAPMFRVISDQSAWEFYNDATEIATHNTRNESARMYYYRVISDLFAA